MKKAIVVSILLVSFFSAFALSGGDQISISSNVSYFLEKGHVYSQITPSVNVGSNLNIRIDMKQAVNKNSGIKLFNWLFNVYQDYQMFVQITVTGSEELRPLLMSYTGLNLARISSTYDDLFIIEAFWQAGSTDPVSLSFQVVPQLGDDYKVSIKYYLVRKTDIKVDEEMLTQYLATGYVPLVYRYAYSQFLDTADTCSESDYSFTIQVTDTLLNQAELIEKNRGILDSNNKLIGMSESLIENDNSLLIPDDYILVNEDYSLLKDSELMLGDPYVMISNPIEDSYGSFVSSRQAHSSEVNEDVFTSSLYDLSFDTSQEVYYGRVGEYLELTVQGYDDFYNRFFEWEKTYSYDFDSWIKSEVEKENRIKRLYEASLIKLGAGTAIVAGTWVVAFCLPGGSLYQTYVLIIADATLKGAIAGAVSGGVVSAVNAFIQGKTDEELLAYTIDGMSTGYLIGAITGFAKGAYDVYKAPKTTFNNGSRTIFDKKVYDEQGRYLGEYLGEIDKYHGRAIINKNLVGSVNEKGIPYRYYLADDGSGHFFSVVNPDFSSVQYVDKVYHVPSELWSNDAALKKWCSNQLMNDLKSENVELILGISKKEASMMSQVLQGLDLRDEAFMSINNLSENEVNSFLKGFNGIDWHHLPSSGDMVAVPRDHGKLASHTGGNSFWGAKKTGIEEIAW